jgi:hypothetical protein
LENIRRFISDSVTLYGVNKVLVITNKPVRCALTGEDAQVKLPGAGNLHGAPVAHFGSIRGIDEWKDYTCVVIVGREQLPVEGSEAQARAFFSMN